MFVLSCFTYFLVSLDDQVLFPVVAADTIPLLYRMNIPYCLPYCRYLSIWTHSIFYCCVIVLKSLHVSPSALAQARVTMIDGRMIVFTSIVHLSVPKVHGEEYPGYEVNTRVRCLYVTMVV